MVHPWSYAVCSVPFLTASDWSNSDVRRTALQMATGNSVVRGPARCWKMFEFRCAGGLQ